MRLIAKFTALLTLVVLSACAPESGSQNAPSPSEVTVQQFDSMNQSEVDLANPSAVAQFEEHLRAARRAKGRIAGGRCESSLHCPGSSMCIDGRCTNSGEGGDRCTSSLHCGGSSMCVSGRCTATSGQAPSRRCESSLHCAGSSMCIDGQCTS